MDSVTFKQSIKQLRFGKALPDAIYIHRRALETESSTLFKLCISAQKALKLSDDSWDIVKLFKKEFKISLLSYPEFDTESYPALKVSYQIDLGARRAKSASYETSENPPILHRKELMVSPADEHYEEFCAITREGEAAGLYHNPFRIGFKQSWNRIIKDAGYVLTNGRLVKNGQRTDKQEHDPNEIDRHLTAIVRHEFSTPLKLLGGHGFLNGKFSIFDYGCGRGDDLRELAAHGIESNGWDPNFRPNEPLLPSDIVNIGFVINVIEDRDERIEALQKAHSLAGTLTVVSAMVAGEAVVSKFKPYKDGVVTSRNTFQKYYNQAELKEYIEHTLQVDAIAVAQGVFYIFTDKIAEQNFLLSRTRRTHAWNHLSQREIGSRAKELVFVKHRGLLEDFWQCCLKLGRLPYQDEFEKYDALTEHIGSPKKALGILDANADITDLNTAARERSDDLLVYFALGLFEKRGRYSDMPETLKRDIKALFANHQNVRSAAKELLFSVSSPTVIHEACVLASQELPSSVYKDGLQFTFHEKYLELLPPALRIYVGCAAQLFGDLEDIDLIKIHVRSSKVSFMGYEGFHDTPLPRLTQRVKVNLRSQEVDYFDYVEPFVPPPLYWKSQLTDESFDDYKKQLSFDAKLSKLCVSVDMASNSGPALSELITILKQQGLEIRGYRFYRTKS